MKRTGLWISAVVGALAVISGLGYLGSRSGTPASPRMITVSVIVANSTGGRWTRFQAGIEKAADDYNVLLNYAVTGPFSSIYNEEKTIRRESEGADAVIVQLVDTSDTVELIREICQARALALVDTDAPAEAGDNFAAITADNTELGAALARQVLRDHEHPVIGIAAGNQNMASMQERLKAFREEAETNGAVIQWVINNPSGIYDAQTTDPADIIVALDNDGLEEAVAARSRLNEEVTVFGVGCSDKTIYDLDHGRIEAMVVPDDFRMGYLAIADVAARVNAPNIPMTHRTIDYSVVTKNNIYDQNNAAALFPVIN